MSTTRSRRLSRIALVLAVAFTANCGGGGDNTPPPPPTLTLSINGGNGQQAAIATAVATAPSVKVTNASSGAGVAGTTVVFSVASGGGTATGLTQTTNSSGVATVGSWTMGTALGANTLTATASGTTGGPLTFNASAVAGAATTIAVSAGNNQSASTGAAVATPPSVKVTDAGGNPVAGTSVTFAVASGGGSITGATQATNSSGIATVGSWNLGASAGTNTLTATATGLTGSPVTFTATASATAPASPISISSVSPALLTPGISATITGSGFSTTAASNIVTVDAVAATVTAATATQLTVTIPAAMPCEPTHDATIAVSQAGVTPVTTTKALQVANQRALTVGQSVIITAAAEQRCNELSNTGTSRYYVNVFNTNRTYNSTGASFELRGASGSGASGGSPSPIAAPTLSLEARRQQARRSTRSELPTPSLARERAHLSLLEQNGRILTERRAQLGRSTGANRSVMGAPTIIATPTVGQTISGLRVPNLNFSSSFCSNYYEITGRVAYVGTKSIIIEDASNALYSTVDATYQQIGNEFDTVMFPILEANYGNPLAMDPVTDKNGRIVMVFTEKVSTQMSSLGLAGFVVSCDYFDRSPANSSSNFGEYFYAKPPTVAGPVGFVGSVLPNTPDNWRWGMRATIIHEVKHNTSFAERFSRGGSFEESWLEETTAQMSEELFTRHLASLAQNGNHGYGSGSTGLYCEARVTCGRPYSHIATFWGLATQWYSAPEDHSPLGRASQSDFSFYQTGWSFLRWAIDNNTAGLSESAFLKALTQEPTKQGLDNLEARAGRTYVEMLPEWTFANVLDDYPSFTPALPRLKQPTWNFRAVYAGFETDYTTNFPGPWPLIVAQQGFGTFVLTDQVRAGTSYFVELSGTQGAKQLLELKASGSSAAAPAELRIAIVRVQ